MARSSVARPLPPAPRVDRASARFTRHVSAALAAAPAAAPALDGRWAELLGGPVRARPGLPRPVTLDALRDAWSRERPLVARWAHPSLGALLLGFPRDLAYALVARTLGERAMPSPRDALSDAAEGVLTALAARAAITLCAPSPPPVLRAITDHPGDALDALDPSFRLVAWEVALEGPALAGLVTLVLDGAALRPPPPPPIDLARLDEVGVAVRCVAARGALAADEVAALGAGDVLRLDGLRRAGDLLAGDVTLCLGAEPALRLDATLTDAVRVTVAAPLRGPWSPMMSESEEALRALSVEVTVELGAMTAPLGEVAAWGVGAIVELPQRIGDAVLVRAGGRAIARGELVDVDGQVGVRITERI